MVTQDTTTAVMVNKISLRLPLRIKSYHVISRYRVGFGSWNFFSEFATLGPSQGGVKWPQKWPTGRRFRDSAVIAFFECRCYRAVNVRRNFPSEKKTPKKKVEFRKYCFNLLELALDGSRHRSKRLGKSECFNVQTFLRSWGDKYKKVFQTRLRENGGVWGEKCHGKKCSELFVDAKISFSAIMASRNTP